MNFSFFRLLFVVSLLLPFSGQTKSHSSFHYKGERISLKGGWEFYWSQLFDSSELVKHRNMTAVVQLPNYWNRHSELDIQLPSFGYATYAARILSDDEYAVGIRYAAGHCAQRILLNGKVIAETGVVDSVSENYQPLWIPGTAVADFRRGENILILQIANFDHKNGGVFAIPEVGPKIEMLAERESQLIIESVIVGSLIIAGMFFIGLFIMWHEDLKFLFYGLFAVSFSIWFANYGLHIGKVAWPSLSWGLTIRVSYIGLYMSFGFINLFMYESFKSLMNKKVTLMMFGFFSINAVIVLFTKPYFFSQLLNYVHIIGFLMLLYVIIVAIIALVKKQRSSALLVIANLAYIVAILLLAGMFHNLIGRSGVISSILFLITFFLYAITLAQNIQMAFYSVYKLQKETNNQKNQIKEQAQKLERLDEFKSRFFANVSHDFRSPLTLIIGYLELFRKEKNQLTGDSVDSLEKVTKNVKKLVLLTDEIRDLIKLEEGEIKLKFQKVEFGYLTESWVGMFESMASEKHIRLTMVNDLPAGFFIHCDPYNMEKVVYNLVSNAIKYSHQGSEVRVQLKSSFSGEKEAVEFTVSDDGPGINQDELPMIFDRFYQSKSNQHQVKEGLGIGLSLVKEIVDLHGGEISASSELGKGTMLKVLLPMNLEKACNPSFYSAQYSRDRLGEGGDLGSNSGSTSINPKKKTILVVEDHEEVRKYVVSVVKGDRDILEAEDGKAALEILQKYSVDMIITDLMMPVMDGYQLIETIKSVSLLSSIPIIVLSAHVMNGERQRLEKLGVDAILIKPFDTTEINQLVDRFLHPPN